MREKKSKTKTMLCAKRAHERLCTFGYNNNNMIIITQRNKDDAHLIFFILCV